MDLYGLFALLVSKSELSAIEKGDAHAVIENLEKLNAFGVAGKMKVQRHQCSAILETGKCSHCGIQMQEPIHRRPGRWH